MKKIICIIFGFLAFSANASWVGQGANSNNVAKFLKAEVQAEGNHSIKVKKVQSDSKKPGLYRVFAVVENTYQPDEGETQKAISCDVIYVSKNSKSYEIVSWNKEECSIEDIILLKQQY